MQTNVKPGMLAYIVAIPGIQVHHPEILGRIVFVEGPRDPNYIYCHPDGRRMQDTNIYTEPVWRVSAKEPLPAKVFYPGCPEETWYMYERSIVDASLRPLLDPDLDVSDEEVKELYSTKEKECLLSQ